MLKSRLVKVPRALHAVTSIDNAAECDPQDVGMNVSGVQRIWSAVEGLYKTGTQPAITMVIRRHGKIVMKRSIGQLRGNAPGEHEEPRTLTPDAPVCLFSASKAISSLLIHKLVEDNKLSLEDRVADHIPDFAAHGKGQVTIRQLLAHRAGIPTIPMKHPEPEMLQHWDALVHMLCLAPPSDPLFRKQAYHALTSGFIVGELVRRASRRELRDVMHEWIEKPLKLKYLNYGLPEHLREQSPRNHSTGPKPFWPVTSFSKRILGVPFERATEASNSDGFMSAIVPAGNIYASADDANRVFQMLLNGGELDGVRVFKEQTVAEAIRPIGKMQFDGMLMVPIRFSAGFILGEAPFGLYGPRTEQAFGHLGFLSILCWADPQRDISVSFLTTGKSIAPTGVLALVKVLGAISRACPRIS